MLYITFLWPNYFITGSYYPLTSSPILLTPIPHFWQHSIWSLYLWASFCCLFLQILSISEIFFLSVKLYGICLFLSAYFLSIMPLRSIDVIANGKISFLWLSNIPLRLFHIFFIHSSTDGNQWFHNLSYYK